nr:phosphoribosyltransferase family protein [uncultured Ruminococcus sp.]
MIEPLYYLRALIYPEHCPYCGKPVEPHEIACPLCMEIIKQKHSPIQGGAAGFRCISSFVYDGKVRRAVLRIKYRKRVQYIPQLAAILAQDINSCYGEECFDLITDVPMHKTDVKERGYNQSELLAKELSKLLGVPYADTLIKTKRTKKQHDLYFTERKTNLSGAFALTDKEVLTGKRILLIDDIITSGNTLSKCCKVLSKAKPSKICCATIASAQNKYPKETII